MEIRGRGRTAAARRDRAARGQVIYAHGQGAGRHYATGGMGFQSRSR